MGKSFLHPTPHVGKPPEERRGPFRKTGTSLNVLNEPELYDAANRCITCKSPECSTGATVGRAGQDAPGCLLGNPNGVIHGMIKEAGKAFERAQDPDISARQKRAHMAEALLLRKQAWQLSSETSPVGLWMRVCPTGEGLCQTTCVLSTKWGSGHGSVDMPSIESALHREAHERDWVKIKPKKENGLKLSIIGTGPMGVAAAKLLRPKGWLVEMFDREGIPGGQAALGIPDKKLSPHDVAVEFQALKKGGVKVQCNTEVGAEGNWFHRINAKAGRLAATISSKLGLSARVPFADVVSSSDVVLLGPGLYKPRKSSIKGPSEPAFNFLFRHKYIQRGINHPRYVQGKDHLDAKDKRIVVEGGGDTARDCANTALLEQGAKSALIIYRKDPQDMPGAEKEYKEAVENGVQFMFRTRLIGSKENKDGTFTLTAIKTDVVEDPKTGRRKAVDIPDSEFEIEADMPPVTAIGQDPEDYPKLFSHGALRTNGWGGLDVQEMKGVHLPGRREETRRVTLPHSDQDSFGLVCIFKTESGKLVPCFAGGDAVGTGLLIEAVHGGREGSKVIDSVGKDIKKFAADNPECVVNL